ESARLLNRAVEAIAAERKNNPGDRNLLLSEAEADITLGQLAARRNTAAIAVAHWQRARDTIAPAAQLGPDPNFLSAWARALLLLDDAPAARPVLDRLGSMGYRTPAFDALLAAKKEAYQPNASACGSDKE